MFFILTSLLGGILLKSTKVKPISSILILFGIIIGLFHKYFGNGNIYNNSIDFWIELNPQIFLSFFIPPLIYEASFNINFHIFRKTIYLILILSFFGVLLNIILISIFIYAIDSNFYNFYCLFLGSILGAIDPTAVTLLLSELKLSDKLSNLIEGESLLNDEVAILTLYIIKKIFIQHHSTSIILIESIRLVFGSILIGGVLSLIKIFFLGISYGDFISEVTITLSFCYLAYFLSEKTIFKTSGILSVVIIGVIMSAFGKTRISPKNIGKIYDIWKLLASYSNIIIYTVSGIIISNKIVFNNIYYYHWFKLFALYIYINFIRFICCLLFYPCLRKNIFHYDYIDFIVISLSGLRGEISLALSLFILSDNVIPFKIRNLIVFYVSGIVFFTITINSNLIKYIIRHFHRDKITMTTKHLDSIKSHIIREGQLYLENLKETDFHLSKVNYDIVKKHLYTNINYGDVLLLENVPNENLGKKIYLNTLKKTIWILFEENILHYDVITKLIDIVDSYLDHFDEPWGGYMNEYCQKEHINTSFICFLEKIPCSKYITKQIIYHRIEYNYNLILGYIYALKMSKNKIREIIDNPIIISQINNEVMEALHYPHIYMEYLEEKYGEILVKIETKQMILLVISKHKSHLEYLKKNGEISEKIYETLLQKFNKKENYLKNNL